MRTENRYSLSTVNRTLPKNAAISAVPRATPSPGFSQRMLPEVITERSIPPVQPNLRAPRSAWRGGLQKDRAYDQK